MWIKTRATRLIKAAAIVLGGLIFSLLWRGEDPYEKN